MRAEVQAVVSKSPKKALDRIERIYPYIMTEGMPARLPEHAFKGLWRAAEALGEMDLARAECDRLVRILLRHGFPQVPLSILTCPFQQGGVRRLVLKSSPW